MHYAWFWSNNFKPGWLLTSSLMLLRLIPRHLKYWKSELQNSLCRAAAIGAFSGLGVIGTDDGLVYAWELSSGAKLGTLHHFKGMLQSCPNWFAVLYSCEASDLYPNSESYWLDLSSIYVFSFLFYIVTVNWDALSSWLDILVCYYL